MDFINEEFYQKQKIVCQYINSKNKLFIITRDKYDTYTLWYDGKKIATNENPLKLYEKTN